jgi:hypothetical protein
MTLPDSSGELVKLEECLPYFAGVREYVGTGYIVSLPVTGWDTHSSGPV